jgi:aryl-alcohol dehydrogenase-like predicted oxidoreductase
MNAITPDKLVNLGGLRVSRQGYGAMGLSHTYGHAEDAASIKTIHHAIELGINFFDTAEAYGQGHNETLLGEALKGKRDGLVVATKFSGGGGIAEGNVKNIAKSLEASLKRLQVDVIDLYYQHRQDATVPVEDVVGELARYVEQGKIKAIGLSEVSLATLKRAHAVHPITAVQSEYSLWTRDFEADVIPFIRENNIGYVAYSPLGRGFLAGQENTDDGNRRGVHPRFTPEAIAANGVRRKAIEAVAATHGVTIAQVALAWVLSKPGIVPIPGTRHISHLEQNWAANKLVLAQGDIAALEDAFPRGATFGTRYPAEQLTKVNA